MATTQIYTLSLHDALPILAGLDQLGHLAEQEREHECADVRAVDVGVAHDDHLVVARLLEVRSEEHTSELQSLRHLVCRLLLEKKNDREGVTNWSSRTLRLK